MANVVGAKTTKAKEAESLKAARTRHRVGAGQLFIQPNAHADREAAQSFRAEDDDTAAVEFVRTGKAVQEAIRPTYRYQPTSSINAEVRRYPEPTGTLIDLGDGWKVRVGDGLTTPKQAKWMIDIASRPSITEPMRESLRLRLEQGFARTAASAFITKYKDTPIEATPAQAREGHATSRTGAPLVDQEGAASEAPAIRPTVKVEEGRYAVEEDGVLKFFRVSHGKGRWAGRIFLEIQASDERYGIRSSFRRNAILATIAANPLEASVRYGTELGKCYACGRTLTDATSRELGIGPDCRSK